MAGRLRLIGDRWGSGGAITVHQDIAIFAGELSEGEKLTHEFADGRRGWLHVARGIVRLNLDELRQGDGARIEGEPMIELDTDHRAEILLFFQMMHACVRYIGCLAFLVTAMPPVRAEEACRLKPAKLLQ